MKKKVKNIRILIIAVVFVLGVFLLMFAFQDKVLLSPGDVEVVREIGELIVCKGDATGDGIIDARDTSVVRENFGQECLGSVCGDFDGNGLVDANDLGIIRAQFGGECINDVTIRINSNLKELAIEEDISDYWKIVNPGSFSSDIFEFNEKDNTWLIIDDSEINGEFTYQVAPRIDNPIGYFYYLDSGVFVQDTIGVGEPVECPGDVSGDGVVDAVDLGLIRTNFGLFPCEAPDWCSRMDIDRTGAVDATDLAILRENFGLDCRGAT